MLIKRAFYNKFHFCTMIPTENHAKRCGFLLALFCETKVTGIRLPIMTIEACKDLLFKSLFFIL